MRRPFITAITVLLGCAAQTFAAQGFHWDSSVFYQPDEPLRARGVEAKGLVAYFRQLEKVCIDAFASETTPEQLDIVVGLKPRRKVRVWIVSSRRSSQDKSLAALRKKLEAVPAYPVHGGPVAFALRCTIAGAVLPKEKEPYQPPRPKEWRDAAAKGPVLVPDGIFERIWRD